MYLEICSLKIMETDSYNISIAISILFYSSGHWGGALYMDFDVEVINHKTNFIQNEAQRGAALYMIGRVHSVNTDCDFLSNYAVLNGGSMYIWDGVNCSNINCNFIQNIGMYFNLVQCNLVQ